MSTCEFCGDNTTNQACDCALAKKAAVDMVEAQELADSVRQQADALGQLYLRKAMADAELTDPATNQVNEFYGSRYLDLAGILSVVRPVYARHGLTITWSVISKDSTVQVCCYIHYGSAEIESGFVQPPGSFRDVQKLGSALTYLRRYSLLLVVPIAAGDDDDGNAAAITEPAQAKPKPKPRPRPKPPAPVVPQDGPAPADAAEKLHALAIEQNFQFEDRRVFDEFVSIVLDGTTPAELTQSQANGLHAGLSKPFSQWDSRGIQALADAMAQVGEREAIQAVDND